MIGCPMSCVAWFSQADCPRPSRVPFEENKTPDRSGPGRCLPIGGKPKKRAAGVCSRVVFTKGRGLGRHAQKSRDSSTRATL